MPGSRTVSGLVGAGDGRPASLQSVSVLATIQGILGHVEATLTYRNQDERPLEVVYVFPLDEQSAVYKLEAHIDGRTIVAECQEKTQTADGAVKSDEDPAFLLEHDVSEGVFKCLLGSLPPKTDATMKLAYVTELNQEVDDSWTFVLPTVLNPRRQSGSTNGETPSTCDEADISSPYHLDLQAVVCSKNGAAVTITSEKDKLSTTNEDGNEKIRVSLAEPFSYDHDLMFNVLYDEQTTADVRLEAPIADESQGHLLQEHVVMVTFCPEARTPEKSSNAEFVIIVNCSDSEAGRSPADVTDTLEVLLMALPDGCLFNLVCCSQNVLSLFEEGSRRYGPKTLKQAKDLLTKMGEAKGGADAGSTSLKRGLDLVYSCKPHEGFPKQILMLLDGGVPNESEVISLVRRNSATTRLFTIGIGDQVSSFLARGVAAAGRGRAVLGRKKDDIQEKILKLLELARQPKFTDLKLTFDRHSENDVSIRVPDSVPVVFAGQTCILFAFFKNAKAAKRKAVLSGKMKSKRFEHVLTFDLGKANAGKVAHRMAVMTLIRELEKKETENGLDQKREIIDASTEGNIVSRYTSVVGVDRRGGVEHRLGVAAPRRTIQFVTPAEPDSPNSDRQSPSTPHKKKFFTGSYSHSERIRIRAKVKLEEEMCDIRATMEEEAGAPPGGADIKGARESSIASLIALQNPDGSWPLDDDLAGVLGVTLASMEESGLKTPTVWATILAVTWLILKCYVKEGACAEWDVVLVNASEWLSDHNWAGFSPNMAFEHAKTFLTQVK